MAKYRMKPVVIEAIQWNGANHLICETFMKGSGAYISYEFSQIGEIVVPTPEGNMLASPGDWIIKGVNGEFYPCKSDIFDKTYIEDGDDFIGRIVNEKNELDDRAGKLGGFVNTEKFHSLDSEMQSLMVEQYDVMKRYSVILGKRLELLGA